MRVEKEGVEGARAERIAIRERESREVVRVEEERE